MSRRRPNNTKAGEPVRSWAHVNVVFNEGRDKLLGFGSDGMPNWHPMPLALPIASSHSGGVEKDFCVDDFTECSINMGTLTSISRMNEVEVTRTT